jgi:hypothetical protein
MVQLVIAQRSGLFYPGGARLIVYLAQTLRRVMKRLKKSDLVVTQPGNFFGDFPFSDIFKNQN